MACVLIVTLEGRGGELDRTFVTYEDGNDAAEAANLAVHGVIDDWILSPGDTIKIVEV